MSYYSDDESVDIRVKRYHSPSPRYAPPRERPHSYYQTGVPFLNGERTLITTHERSRERSRERRSPPTSSANAPVAAPVVIHNKIVNEQSSDDDYYSDDSHHHRRHRSSHGRSHSRSHYSRPSSPGAVELARDQWELERARRELEAIRLEQSRERDERRLDKQYREEAELHRAKRDLDEIRRREARDADEKRIRKEIELKQLEEERRAAQEKKRREKEAEAAVAKYKAEEAERAIKQKAERERAEKEYQRRMQEDLIHAGVDEKDIEAILKREKIKRDDERKRVEGEMQVGRPTYTRMSLQYLDIETLLFHKIEFEYDQVCQEEKRRKKNTFHSNQLH